MNPETAVTCNRGHFNQVFFAVKLYGHVETYIDAYAWTTRGNHICLYLYHSRKYSAMDNTLLMLVLLVSGGSKMGLEPPNPPPISITR